MRHTLPWLSVDIRTHFLQNMTILGTKIDTSRLDLVWFSFEGLKFLTCAEADLQPRATAHGEHTHVTPRHWWHAKCHF